MPDFFTDNGEKQTISAPLLAVALRADAIVETWT